MYMRTQVFIFAGLNYILTQDKMKVCIYIPVLVMSCLVAVNSQTCPTEHYSAVFTATIDQTIDDPAAYMDDPELTFFKTELKFRDSDIQHTIDDAIQFFNNTYGLDFSDSPPNEKNQRFLPNARMNPFMLIPGKLDFIVTDSRWIRTGNTHSSCYFIHSGGFQVTFSADQTLYGSYGGDEGKPAGIGNSMIYAFHIINDVCKQSPLIIQVQNTRPVRTEPVDGVRIAISDLYNPVLGYGKLYSIYQSSPVPGGFYLFARTVFTFSGQ